VLRFLRPRRAFHLTGQPGDQRDHAPSGKARRPGAAENLSARPGHIITSASQVATTRCGRPTQSRGFPGLRTKQELFLDRLRALPNRADIHELELRLFERMDSLAARFDRALDSHSRQS
jgi:hypothetical protein